MKNFHRLHWFLTGGSLFSAFIFVACIASTARASLFFDLTTQPLAFDIEETLPPQQLTSLAAQAVAVAPAWLRQDLTDNFLDMDQDCQNVYAQMILAPAEERFTDEMAFCAAQMAPETLCDSMFIPGLLEENIFYLYEHDQYLDYVEIVDSGRPGETDDYFSTVRYRVEENGITDEFDLEPELYYWFLVHPKIEDEDVDYVDPDSVGAPHAAPPTGVFWRDWVFTFTEPMPGSDEDYPVLRDQFAGVDVLWKNRVNDIDNGAVGVITQWILDVLDFTSGTERPVQPVRVYKLHVGRCGEHQDLTSAASRACLIPCVNTQAVNQDHVWNEFWDRRWVHWEPVNIYVDSPLTYENGWGKAFSGVMNIAGDGYAWNVLDRYSEGSCQVRVNLRDGRGDPIDGARISFRTDTGLVGSWGFTGSDGQVQLAYGDDVPCYVRANTELGMFPANDFLALVPRTEAGAEYEWNAGMFATLPSIPATPADRANRTTEFRIAVAYEVQSEVRYGYYPYDRGQHYSRRADSGSLDFFIVDAANFALYTNGAPFTAYELHWFAQDYTGAFLFPYSGQWHVVLSAERKLLCRQNAAISAVLQQQTGGEWHNLAELSREVQIFPSERYSMMVEIPDVMPTATPPPLPTLTPAPEPTETPEPPPTMTPEPSSPTPAPSFSIELIMPSHFFRMGDLCSLIARAHNPGGPIDQAPLVVLLDVGIGEYWFWPSWGHYPPEFDFSYALVSAGVSDHVIIPEFQWPDIEGSLSGAWFLGAVLTPDMTAIVGEYGQWEFGY